VQHAGNTVTVEQATTMWTWRVGSSGWETTTIREEGESDEFFIFISVRMTVLPVGPFGRQGPPTHVQMKQTPYSRHYTIMSEGRVLLKAQVWFW
jgi:hypothetical protein